jgi:hypothetical protein
MKLLFTFFLFVAILNTHAQSVGINTPTPDASAVLDVKATDKGILIPRVALSSTSIAAPVVAPLTSLLIYNTATSGVSPNDVKPGYYYWDGVKWVGIGGNSWRLQGNAGTSPTTNYIGTMDAQDLVLKTNNVETIRINSTTNNVGINNPTPAPAAKLDVVSTTAGFAMPRMTTMQRYAIATPIDGLQVYDTDLKDFYYYNGTKWDCVSVRAGTVAYFANAVAPTGYLACDGASYSATMYPELAAALLYLYGGAGLNFNVPDLRGEFIRGVSTGRVGVDAGRVIGTGQAASVHRELGGAGGVGNINNWWSDSKLNVISDGGGVLAGSPSNGSQIVSPYGNNPAAVVIYEFQHRPRNVAMLPCIKY